MTETVSEAIGPGESPTASDEGVLVRDTSIQALLGTVMAAVVAGSLEGWLYSLLAAGHVTWQMAVVYHVAITALLLGFVGVCIWRDSGVRTAAILLIAEASLGPLGCVGSVLMIVLFLFFRRRAHSFLAWYLDLFPTEKKSLGQDLFDKLITGRARDDDKESVSTFADLLAHGTPQQKQVILALLARNFQPVFAPVLHRAMNDPDATVRVMAATVVAKVENEFLVRVMALRTACRNAPDHHDTWLSMARLYDDYAFTGLLDADRERENRALAEEAHRHCLSIRPEGIASWLAVGRLCLRGGRIEEAVACFDEAARLDPARIDVVVWLMEAHFRDNGFAMVRTLALRLGSDLDAIQGLHEDVKRALRLWRGERL
ncbi:MAG: hypothetical protein ABT940_04595 [Alphaproteobacteria bacterium]